MEQSGFGILAIMWSLHDVWPRMRVAPCVWFTEMRSCLVGGRMGKFVCSDLTMDNWSGRLITLIKEVKHIYIEGVYALCISTNLKFFCSGGSEGEVRVWEMRTREMVSHLKEHTHRVTRVQLYGNETQLVTASRDRALLQWDLKSEKRISAHIQRMGGFA